VEAADGLALRDVARVAAHALVAARAECERPLAREDDDADLGSSRACSIAREISMIVWGRKALRTSGRSMVIFAIPSPLSS
jgi:hypothetical protein